MKRIILLILISILMVGCLEKENKNLSPINESPDDLDGFKEADDNQAEALQEPDFTSFEYINVFMEPFEKPDNEIGILMVDIKYPFIKNASEKKGFQKIHDYYKNAYEAMRDYISTEALTYAREDMAAAEAIEGHFISHSLTVNYDITYQDLQKLTILIQASDYTGGAHGNHWLQAKTFDLNTGESLMLHDILGLDEQAARTYVFEGIEAELKKSESKEIYYEDALETYQDVYNFEDFYLEEDHIVIFFQSYALAPYVAGLPSFKLNFPENK